MTAAADHSLDGSQAYRHIHKTGMSDLDSELILKLQNCSNFIAVFAGGEVCSSSNSSC